MKKVDICKTQPRSPNATFSPTCVKHQFSDQWAINDCNADTCPAPLLTQGNHSVGFLRFGEVWGQLKQGKTVFYVAYVLMQDFSFYLTLNFLTTACRPSFSKRSTSKELNLFCNEIKKLKEIYGVFGNMTELRCSPYWILHVYAGRSETFPLLSQVNQHH